MADGRMIVLEPEDFADLPLSSKKVIDVLEFVPADQVDPLYLGKSYYLAPTAVPVPSRTCCSAMRWRAPSSTRW